MEMEVGNMEGGVQVRHYFSPRYDREKKFHLAGWGMFLILAAVLLVYWEEFRNLEHIEALYFAVAGTAGEYIFRAITFLGDDEGFMLIIALVYWCFNKSIGFWALVALLVSAGVNFGIKEITDLPRPEISGIEHPDNPAFPSGHTMSSLVLWGYLAVSFQRRDFWIWTLIAVVMIGVSRLFLGYHFVGDVIGGLLLGYLFLALFFKAYYSWYHGATRLSFRVKMIAFFLGAVAALLAVVFLPFTADLLMVLGFLAGGCLGRVLEKETVGFSTEGNLLQYVLRMLLGALGIALVIGVLLPLLSYHVAVEFFLFALATFWAFYLAPLLFVKLKLCKSAKE